MKHLGTGTLETQRLTLRRIVAGDAQAAYDNWTSDPEVTKYLMWPTHTSIEVTKGILKSWISQYAKDDFYLWAIVSVELGEPIGTISVVEMDDKVGKVQIGYALGKKWWNCGIMSEALAAVMEYLFREVGVNRIEARHDPRNPGSGKVMQKCGMIYEGTHRQADWNNQGVCDAAVYAMLADAYF